MREPKKMKSNQDSRQTCQIGTDKPFNRTVQRQTGTTGGLIIGTLKFFQLKAHEPTEVET